MCVWALYSFKPFSDTMKRFPTQNARKNNKIGTINDWGEEFEINFWFRVNDASIIGTPNILHLTTEEDNEKIGNRIPSLYFNNDNKYSSGEISRPRYVFTASVIHLSAA